MSKLNELEEEVRLLLLAETKKALLSHMTDVATALIGAYCGIRPFGYGMPPGLDSGAAIKENP